jgi:hypothetical protein
VLFFSEYKTMLYYSLFCVRSTRQCFTTYFVHFVQSTRPRFTTTYFVPFVHSTRPCFTTTQNKLKICFICRLHISKSRVKDNMFTTVILLLHYMFRDPAREEMDYHVVCFTLSWEKRGRGYGCINENPH